MYHYDQFDRQIVTTRALQFKGQVERHLRGELSDEEFLPLRLQNGLYVQKQAPMMRIAVPYGMLSSAQLRVLANICRNYDRGYCHFTTRQNIQLNWVNIEETPAILSELATAEMHAIQTSGNCIRNTTSDPFAGVAADEAVDPRPYCEIIRQWSTLHPEFAFLPRKFKIAVIGSIEDRAAMRAHDIGLRINLDKNNRRMIEVWVGGGQGRTPMLAKRLNPHLPEAQLLNYLKAILRVYNRYGRRDNKYKARIKILVNALGISAFKEQVEKEFNSTPNPDLHLHEEELAHARQFFSAPAYDCQHALNAQQACDTYAQVNPNFAHWLANNVTTHRVAGYAIVTVSLKTPNRAPGDITSEQLDSLADIAETFSFAEIRSTQQQNVVLADVPKQQLFDLWRQLSTAGLAEANINTITDIVCCPGGDYCNLANARSLPIANAIQEYFSAWQKQHQLGSISLKISGCINACAHHHLANIGILGVDKKGEEFYQFTLGGSENDASAATLDERAKLGKVLGPSIPADQVITALERILNFYLQERKNTEETFLSVANRLGREAFKKEVYQRG